MKGSLPWILLILVAVVGVVLYMRGDAVSAELKEKIRVKEQEHVEALVLVDSLANEVDTADSLAEAIERTLTHDLERSQAEVGRLRSSTDSIMVEIETMKEEIPPRAMELVQSLHESHNAEVTEYTRQLVLKDQMMSWKDFQLQERDRYIQGLRAAQARANELISLQDAALNPTFSTQIKRSLPVIIGTAAVTATAILVL